MAKQIDGLRLKLDSSNALDQKIMDELSKSPATQLDLYYLRNDLYKVEKKLDAWVHERHVALDGVRDLINKHIQSHKVFQEELHMFQEDMKKGLFINIGEKDDQKLASVGEISLINYHDLRFLRDFNKIYTVIKKHKILFLLILATLLVYGSKIMGFIQWILSLIGMFDKIN